MKYKTHVRETTQYDILQVTWGFLQYKNKATYTVIFF